MNESRIHVRGKMNRPGFGIFLVFILTLGLAAIIMVMYNEEYNPFAAWQGSAKDRYAAPGLQPWEEDRLFWGGGTLEGYGMTGKRGPFANQPQIKGAWRYETTISDGNNPMGTLNVGVLSNFDALAFWKGEFDIGGKHYTADLWTETRMNKTLNSFSGNIYPLKIYQDNKGQDRTKLYFITRGFYELRGQQKEDTRRGVAYVNGWVNKKLAAEGTLSIPQFDNGKDLIIKWGPIFPKKE
jgi:hypothetical protein